VWQDLIELKARMSQQSDVNHRKTFSIRSPLQLEKLSHLNSSESRKNQALTQTQFITTKHTSTGFFPSVCSA